MKMLVWVIFIDKVAYNNYDRNKPNQGLFAKLTLYSTWAYVIIAFMDMIEQH